LTIIGSKTTCPICRRESELISGEYRATFDAIELLVDPSISAEGRAALQQLLEQTRAGKISVEEARAAASKISEKAAAFFNFGNWPPEVKGALIGAAINALVVLGARVIGPEVVVNNQTVIERIVDHPTREAQVPVPRPNPRRTPDR
jgi:hypothetical protein